MLYHYYMKINLKLLFTAVLTTAFFPCAWAQVTVVKQDGKKIYLDTSDFNRHVSVGDLFKIITSQEKLTNPKTGKELGMINHYSPEGKIIEVHPLYAVGEMTDKTAYSIGQEAVIESLQQTQPIVSSTKTQQSAQTTQPVSNRKIKKYPVLQQEVISAVKADLNIYPSEEIAVADTKGNIVLYTQENGNLRQIARYTLPDGKRIVTLSAKNIMKTPHSQLFATIYDEKNQKITTLVLQAEDDSLRLIDTLPYFVKEIGCGDDKEIYAQKPFINGAKAGDARELEYEKGKFRLDDDRIPTRGHWLTGTNYYEIQNKENDNFVYTAHNGKLRMRLQNGKYAESPALFATAANRVKYKQEIIAFYPSLQVYGPDGKATLFAVENTAKMGILSEQFGQYNGSKIHFLTYENGVLGIKETLSLDGFVYDNNCTARGILVPQVLSSGQTVLTEIYR